MVGLAGLHRRPREAVYVGLMRPGYGVWFLGSSGVLDLDLGPGRLVPQTNPPPRSTSVMGEARDVKVVPFNGRVSSMEYANALWFDKRVADRTQNHEMLERKVTNK